MQIAKNVEMLEVQSLNGTLYPVLAWDGNALVLIDAGMPGEIGALREAVQGAGFALEDITAVILTHQDLDHIGNAKALAGMGAEIWAHEAEAPYIQGDKLSIRLSDMESRRDEWDEEERAFYERAKMGAPLFTVPVNKRLADGEVLDVCGGIRVLHTPGHMPGHIAVVLLESNILVAGDAANIADGKLAGANPDYTRDVAEAQVSFEKILAAKAAGVVCYHGGLYQ